MLTGHAHAHAVQDEEADATFLALKSQNQSSHCKDAEYYAVLAVSQSAMSWITVTHQRCAAGEHTLNTSATEAGVPTPMVSPIDTS